MTKFPTPARPLSHRRQLLTAAVVAATLLSSGLALAQASFPAKPITLIVPFPPGGATDTQFRALGNAVSKDLKQPVVIVNQPGAAGTMAPGAMARSAAADGYTLAVIASSVYRVPHVQKVSYDAVNDFTYIAGVSEFTFGVVVAADSPYKTAHDLVAAARAQPGALAVGSISNGSSGHIALLRWAASAGFIPNFIPYKGGAEVIQGVLGGQLAAMSESSWGPMVQQGKLRALAIYGRQRSSQFPNVPTLKELGWDVMTESVVGIAGPKGMDPAIAKVLQDAIQRASADPDFLRTLALSGQSVSFKDSVTYTKFVAEQFRAEKKSIDALKAAGVVLTN
jgi:tripartite-type tricarboxylate transporter receptor subunit TctC